MAQVEPGARPRSLRLWAIGAALVVIAGIVAALVSGGGNDGSVVANAPRPPGDQVLTAGETDIDGVHYVVVVSRPKTAGPKRGAVPVYFNEYVGRRRQLVQRFRVPGRFARDSMIENFKVDANSGILFSWLLHPGHQTEKTRYFDITPQGIQVY